MTAELPVVIPMTHAHTMRSEQTGRDYHIAVALPFAYARKPTELFPVVYVLDGDLFFAMVTSITRMLRLGRFPSVIVVGVGYGLASVYDADFKEFAVRRATDFTPSVDESFEDQVFEWLHVGVETGGAPAFLAFLAHELIPFIESAYRVNSAERVLLGHSLGGLFALYTMLQEPRVFPKFIVGSPALGYGDQSMFAREAEYAAQHTRLPAHLFLGIGEEEEQIGNPLDEMVSVADVYRLTARLHQRQYPDFGLVRRVFAGCNHTSVPAPLFQAGLTYLLAGE